MAGAPLGALGGIATDFLSTLSVALGVGTSRFTPIGGAGGGGIALPDVDGPAGLGEGTVPSAGCLGAGGLTIALGLGTGTGAARLLAGAAVLQGVTAFRALGVMSHRAFLSVSSCFTRLGAAAVGFARSNETLEPPRRGVTVLKTMSVSRTTLRS